MMERSPLQKKFEEFNSTIKWVLNHNPIRTTQYELYKILIEKLISDNTTDVDRSFQQISINELMTNTIQIVTDLYKEINNNPGKYIDNEETDIEPKIQQIWDTIQTQLTTIFGSSAGDTDIIGSVNHYNFATECDIYHDAYTELKSLLQSNENLTPNEQALLSNLDFVNTLLGSITPNMITLELYEILKIFNGLLVFMQSNYNDKTYTKEQMISSMLDIIKNNILHIYALLYGTGTFTQKYEFHNGHTIQEKYINEGEHRRDI